MGFPFAGFPDGFFMYNLMPTKTSSLWRIHISIYSMPLVFASRHWPGGEGMVRRYHSRHGVAPLPPRQRLSSSRLAHWDCCPDNRHPHSDTLVETSNCRHHDVCVLRQYHGTRLRRESVQSRPFLRFVETRPRNAAGKAIVLYVLAVSLFHT